MSVTKRITLGSRETRLLFELEARQLDVFDVADAGRLLRVPSHVASGVLHRLRRKGRVLEIRKGEYLLVPARAGVEGGWSESIFRVVDSVFREGYYVGFWAAMKHWGMTDQIPRITHVVMTGRRRNFRFQGQDVRIVTMHPARIFGSVRLPIGRGTFAISDRERTVLDGLLLPRYVGGVTEVAKALSEARRELRWGLLEAYAGRLGVDSVARRLGYLVDVLGVRPPLARRLRRGFRGFRWLDPSGPRLRLGYSKEWGLILNVPAFELTAAR